MAWENRGDENHVVADGEGRWGENDVIEDIS
jgi:hypothetical protein